MTQKLIIPKNVKAGFNNRTDTYTGQLAFVIRQDEKGQWKSEKSWKGWRDSKIDPVETKNEPTEGFVLNKGVGGVRQSYGWNARNEYVRIYDPRGWEFEISVANLLFILQETACHPGKGLDGKFVYAWEKGGSKVMLLPCCSQDYSSSQGFTELQAQKISARDLIKGATYRTKDGDDYVYIGYHMVYETSVTRYDYSGEEPPKHRKKHIFYSLKDGKASISESNLEPFSGMNKLACCVDEKPHTKFAKMDSAWHKSRHGTMADKLELRPASDTDRILAFADSNGKIRRYCEQYDCNWNYDIGKWVESGQKHLVYFGGSVQITDGTLIVDRSGDEVRSFPPDFPEEKKRNVMWCRRNIKAWNPPAKREVLVAVLGSGAEYVVNNYGLGEKYNG